MFTIIEVKERPFDQYGRQKKGRLYLFQKGETVAMNFALRDTAKPTREYRLHIFPLLREHGIDVSGAVWNIHAGCSMCRCSPGFILPNHKKDVFVTFQYIVPTPNRQLTEREAYRANALTATLENDTISI